MYQSDITLPGYHVSEWYNFVWVSCIRVIQLCLGIMYQSDITLSGYHVSEWYNFALVSDITVLLRHYINIMFFFCRSCTDIICCLLFVIFIAGLGLVGYFGKIIQMLISKEKKGNCITSLQKIFLNYSSLFPLIL